MATPTKGSKRASRSVTDTDGGRDGPVALKLLGGFALEVAGAQVPLRLSARRLVAFLGLRGESPRSAVAVSLWPNVDQERGKASLRTAMWRLHCLVPGLVQDEQEGIALADPIYIDIKELELIATVTSGSGRMPVGTETYAGDLLPGWYDEWVLCERERLRQVGLRALEARAARLMEEARWADALNVALEVIRLEPLRESAHRAVIAAHLAEDNFGEALRQYSLLSQLLEVDLGIRPSESTRALLYQPGNAGPGPHRPHSPGGPVGRSTPAPSEAARRR